MSTPTDELIAELIRIGATEKSGTERYFPHRFEIPGLTSFDSWESARVRLIGEQLFQQGGSDLLESAQQRVTEKLGALARLELRIVWKQAGLPGF